MFFFAGVDEDYDSDDTLTEEPVRKPTANKKLFKVQDVFILRYQMFR